jgi:methylase of polypeptide subunit release factors
MEDIKAVYPELIFRTEEGIVLEIANDCVADNLDGESLGSGAITIAIDLKVKDLDSNATDLANAYAVDLAEKTEKANAKAKAKADKIARDTASRKKSGV